MKIVICDYPKVLGRNLDYEKELLHKGLDNVEVLVYQYNENEEEFIDVIKDADAIITAFINIDKNILNGAKKLKCISINATGYDNVDLEEANKKNIGVCNINEYCTQDVADHTFSLILALSRGIKHYINAIDKLKKWQYYSVGKLSRLEGQTLGILGFGRIGKAVARRAQGFGINVITYDPYLLSEEADKYNVTLVDLEYLLENSDIISNHMNQNSSNNGFFSMKRFKKMKKKPLFINVARGNSVVEDDLIKALDYGLIRGAGLDVMMEESPDLEKSKLINRENIIITPHAAFYSESSLESLQKISCENTINFLKKEFSSVYSIVNKNYIRLDINNMHLL